MSRRCSLGASDWNCWSRSRTMDSALKVVLVICLECVVLSLEIMIL